MAVPEGRAILSCSIRLAAQKARPCQGWRKRADSAGSARTPVPNPGESRRKEQKAVKAFADLGEGPELPPRSHPVTRRPQRCGHVHPGRISHAVEHRNTGGRGGRVPTIEASFCAWRIPRWIGHRGRSSDCDRSGEGVRRAHSGRQWSHRSCLLPLESEAPLHYIMCYGSAVSMRI